MSDMTQSFIEMVEAYKAKPELEAKIATLEADNGICYQTIELKANQLAEAETRIAELNSRLSEVTKERDDAMFRSLELDEKLSGIEKLLGLAERLEQARRDEHQATVDALTPTPLVEAAVVTEQGSTIIEPSYPGPIDPVVVEGQSEVDPMPVGQPENDTTISKDGPETQTVFDPYKNESWLNQPYDNKPWWVKDDEWYLAGGMLA